MKNRLLVLLLLTLVAFQVNTNACTNFLLTKGASSDGSTMITYSADSHVLYGELYYWPAATYPQGTFVDVVEWDTGKLLGKIKQATQTYAVVGNMNEHQLAIGETTFGGLPQLETQKGAIIDYGSLMYLTLQRAKNAREAIKVMAELLAEYGYASSGESFSISDPNEVWIWEMIGKGEGEKGAVWVARRVPDGYFCGHANQARITTFPLENGKNSISSKSFDKLFNPEIENVYASDVISFAKQKGFYKGEDKNFSFSDVYNPVTFGGARFCDARVWSAFRKLDPEMDKHLDYALGHNLKNRMPLWIKPNKKVSLNDMMGFMRDHYEGTPLDMTKDIGAGPFANPYRWRPLTYKVDSVSYCNERAVATQQTGFSFVTQSRSWLPDPIGGILWFSVDDVASTVYVPIYCGIQTVPETFAVGNGSMMEFSENSAFWVFNQVSNLAYTRFNAIHPEIEKKQKEFETKFITEIPIMDKSAFEIYKRNQDEGKAFITNYSVASANNLVKEWKNLYASLFVKYMDGNIKTVDPESRNPKVSQPGYGDEWQKRIVKETGDHLKVIGDEGH